MMRRIAGVIVLTVTLCAGLATPSQAVDPNFHGRFVGTLDRQDGPARTCGRSLDLGWRISTVNARTRHVRGLSSTYEFALKYRRNAWRGDRSSRRWDYTYALHYHDARGTASTHIVAHRSGVRCDYRGELIAD